MGIAAARELWVGILCWMFWGAALMWLRDAVFEYLEPGAAYFTPAASDLLNGAFLGLSMVALALVIRVAYLLIWDPKSVAKAQLFKNA